MPYSDCYRRSIACSRRGSRCKATARLLPCEIPADNKKQAVSTACFFGGDAGFVANIVCVITEQRRTQCFLNRIVASDNAHSFACVLLFPTGTQYPAGSPEYRISDRLRSTICCKQQCYAFVRQIAQSLAMSAALDFRKCKRLLLSSLAVSPKGFTPQAARHRRAEPPKRKRTRLNRVRFFHLWWEARDTS